LDVRFAGLLRDESILELEFDRDLSQLQSPVLLMHGWVEYGYSQTSFAAWQAGRSYTPPSLEARTEDGQWHRVLDRFGYPAGMPREAAVPLPPLPRGTTALRLRTNQEIYWDQLAVAETLSDVPYRDTRMGNAHAKVERIGFPRRSNGPQRQPEYDFNQRSPFWDTRYPTGQYTAFGPADELVSDRDNALAIIGPGDAVTFRFSNEMQAPPEGWRRSYILDVHGWAKDMDLYTKDGNSVEPLPRAERAVDRSAALNDRFNTRFQSGR
jgi:hypothetical protein